MNALEVKKNIHWIGALDYNLRIFDIIMYTPFGTTYNSYVVQGSEKTAVFETVKEAFFEEYINRLHSLDVDPSKIDYIVVDHTEPDHAGSVAKLLELSPQAKVVGSQAAIKFMKAIANRDFQYIIANDGDSLSLGDKTLKFISAPLLHWPDSIYTYVPEDNLLITCDSFGSHYCNEKVFDDLLDEKENEDYMGALKYYYDCIMGPFKPYVLKAFEKIKNLQIDTVCTGHGPILRKDPWKIINLYKEWSTETPQTDGVMKVVIPYVSAYGYTESLAKKIAEGIASVDNFKIDLYNVIYSKKEEILEKISWADGILFGSPTINSAALEPIVEILSVLNPIVHGRKVAAAFGSYGWSGEAVPNIEARLKELRMDVLSPGLKVNFKPSESELMSAFNFGVSFGEKIKEKLNKSVKPIVTKRWKCIVCGEEFDGNTPPDICPACGAGKEQFIEVKVENITFHSSKKEKFLIIGNGAAGYYAADAIRKRNKLCEIQIISAEKYLTYYRPQLSDCLSAEIPDKEFYVTNESWYKENNITVTLNSTVESIDTDNKKVTLLDHSVVSYNKLILANGSKNFVPQMTGSTLQGVFTLKTLDDAKRIKEKMKDSKKVIVIGGGLLGLEAAWEMKKSGLEVTIVEYFDRLLPLQLDSAGAALLKDKVDQSEINIVLGESTIEILGENQVTGIKLKSGKTLEADLVLFSIGIRPNKQIAKEAGIDVNKGIIVNEKMETNRKYVYACGDVAELNGTVYGNWPAAIEMGKVAGANAVGDHTAFESFISSIVFNAIDTELFSCGSLYNDISKQLEFKKVDGPLYKKLFFEGDMLVGGILLGDTSKSVTLMNGIAEKKSMAEILKEDILL